jgi:polyhydroxybutyrate depolymerase
MLLFMLGASGCTDSEDTLFVISKLGGCADDNTCVSNPPLMINAARPAAVHIPSDYTTTTQYPLVIVLHGFGANGEIQAGYFGLIDRVDTRQYVMVTPDGLRNANGSRYWNATPACCAFSDPEAQVDDVGYIRSLITEAAQTYSIDEDRISLIGHSNGGFLSLRLACEASDIISSVVSLAGSTFVDAASCAPADNPVSVLAIHGTDDATISYDGRDGDTGFPSAPVTTERFAAQAGCDLDNTLREPSFDLVTLLDGIDTDILAYGGCQQGSEVALWTIIDGPHIPLVFGDVGVERIIDWLIYHPRT